MAVLGVDVDAALVGLLAGVQTNLMIGFPNRVRGRLEEDFDFIILPGNTAAKRLKTRPNRVSIRWKERLFMPCPVFCPAKRQRG